ncbi:LuxR C-terminal-related transcriptional regulator [Frankia sp. R43]|uniref:LuxR C-terminal-related transcriptional regulator n=1 Tax=Frankia sp. R43 TaxID=269536 RepID=UPI0006C9F67C|nr:LuxR C-terminal-related transcriptional regulator [Frankia sp. R43]
MADHALTFSAVGADTALDPRPALDARSVFDAGSPARQTLNGLLSGDGDRDEVAWVALTTESGALTIEYVHGQTTPLLDRLSIPSGWGLTGKVFQEQALAWVDGYLGAPTISHEFDEVITAERVVRMIAAPVVAGSRVLGVLTLASRENGAVGGVVSERIRVLAQGIALSLQVAQIARREGMLAERRRVTEEQAATCVGRAGAGVPALTPRELDVLRRVATGSTNAEIASDLGLMVSTVKSYWHSTLGKLGARNRVEAITAARGFGLLA